MPDTPGTPAPAPNNPSNPQADLVAKFISKARVMATNGQLADIQAKIQNRGYPVATLQQKLTALNALEALNQAQHREYGEQYQSTANYNAAEETVHETYMDHLGYARLAFDGNIAAQTGLSLSGRRHRNQAGYAAQGLTFYTNLLGNAGWKTTIATKGVTAAELTAQQAAFTNLAALEAAQAKETGEAQASTAARDAAYETEKKWFKTMRATVRIALRKSPQLSEKMGIKDKS